MTPQEKNASFGMEQAESLSLADLWPILRCYKWILIGLALVGACLGFAYGSRQPPNFTSLASVLIDPQRGELAKVSETTGAGLELSSGMLAAETRLIASPRFVLRIVEDLEMRNHPEYIFEDEPTEDEIRTDFLERWREYGAAVLDELFSGKTLATQVDDQPKEPEQLVQADNTSLTRQLLDSQRAEPEDQLSLDSLTLPELSDTPDQVSGEKDEDGKYLVDHDDALVAVMDRLSVETQADAFLISISYSSSDPNLSARVANYAAELYVAWNLDQKITNIRRSSENLSERLETLRLQLNDAENEIERYTQDNNLLSSSEGSLLIEDELISIRGYLNRARTSLASEQAQYSLLLASRDDVEKVVGIAGNEVAANLTQLQSEASAIQKERAELQITYGAQHPRMIDWLARSEELRSKILVEKDRVVEAQATRVKIAQERVQTLQGMLIDLRQSSASARGNQLQLLELEREAEAKRELYKALLLRYQETGQERKAIQADVRIVKQAMIPDESSVPPPMAFALIGFTSFLSFGTFGVLMRERFRTGFTRLRDAEKALGYNVFSAIPLVKGGKKRNKNKNIRLWEDVSKNPSSAFAESIGKVYVQLAHQIERNTKPTKIIMVTSSVPSEGKTTLSSCLAAYAAQMNSKRRVLVADFDFRRPALSRAFTKRGTGLVEYLLKENPPDLSQITYGSDIKNLDFLPILSPASNSTFLVSSEGMEDLISEARDTYDLIICDCPPVLAINDTKILAKYADLFLMIIRWSSTPINTVQNAIAQLHETEAPIAGAVFSQVNMAKYNNHNYLEGGKYHEEYQKLYTA